MPEANHWGYDGDRWLEALEQARAVLQARAHRNTPTIAYSTLAAQIGAITFQADDRAFHALLGELSEDEDEQGRGMLSVLVVHKTGDQKPGQGFFDLAMELGRCVGDNDETWIAEMNFVTSYWKAVKAGKPPPLRPA